MTSLASLLPEHWSAPEHVEDEVVIDGVTLRRAGLCSGEATGSAVEVGASPLSPRVRAEYELVERMATLDALRATTPSFALCDASGVTRGEVARSEVFRESAAPARWRYARSNGIALHTSWSSACRAARLELCERERVLRAWAGDTRPERIAFGAQLLVGAGTTYTWEAVAFPAPADEDAFGRDIEVVGAFGFPTTAELPLVFGYAARGSRSEALTVAVREATQMMAFLVGEPLPTTMPDLAPTAVYHLDAAQVPERRAVLRRWLDRGHREFSTTTPATRAAVVYVDLTPSWLSNGWKVAKAMCADALPLAFGQGPFLAHLPSELQVHPIA